jgi:hypothetical protein
MLTIPKLVWEQVFRVLSLESREVEQVCYLDGVRLDNGDGVVTTMTFPHARIGRGRFSVDAAAMSEAGKHLRALRLRRLAQVHTHPTEWIGHSECDDERAYSQQIDSMSLVLPNFGRVGQGLKGVGVHVRCAENWRRLDAGQISGHVRLVPSLLDFRPNYEHPVASRHAGTLGGKLLPLGRVDQLDLTIHVTPGAASSPSVQHTAWMLINLMARCEGIVRKIVLSCPRDVTLADRVIPFVRDTLPLREALLQAAAAIGVVPVVLGETSSWVLVVGQGDILPRARYVWGNGWSGGVSTTPITFSPEPCDLPFGPYVAACLAAGEIFKAARLPSGNYQPVTSAFYNLWAHQGGSAPTDCGPSDVAVDIDGALAGAGAVGCSLLHTLWACRQLRGTLSIYDNDPSGVETSNLNRYVLFGRGDVGKMKSSSAAAILGTSNVQWQAHDSDFESAKKRPGRIISAVDSNRARQAIQMNYPSRLFSGSTYDLRAEVLRCGPPGIGACLKCFNTIERRQSDSEVHAELAKRSDSEIASLAAVAGVTLAAAKEWLSKPRCGMPGERLLSVMTRAEGEPSFAVPFVSAMAGTMLAAEFIKDYLDHGGPLSDLRQRAVFQFFRPLARTNGASVYQRDPQCRMCDPASTACTIWKSRHRA